MNTIQKRRILSIAPAAVAVVLSLAACGAPCMSGSNSAPATNGASNSSALSNSTGSSNGATSSGSSGGTSFGASSGGAASGGSASGGQGGVSSGGSAAAGSATPGQAGVASGGFGNSNPAAGMTPDQVAAYCTKFPYDPDIDHGKGAVDAFTALRKNTPVQLVPCVDVMISDSQTIASENRVYAQLKDEMQANFEPLKDFYDQICVAH